jgi:hypothetical protein
VGFQARRGALGRPPDQNGFAQLATLGL